MDLDALIAQITDEVCLRIENDGAVDLGNIQAAATVNIDVAGVMEYTAMDPQMKIEDVQNVCDAAKKKTFACVCVPQWFVAYAKEQLNGTNVKVCTSVSLPGGESSTAAKYAEVKEAVKNGADEVDIPINMSLLELGNLEELKNDLEEAMVPAKDKAVVKAVIEVGDISPDKRTAAIAECKQCHVDYITISSIVCGRAHDIEEAKKVVELCKGSIKVKAVGHIRDARAAGALISLGVDRIGTSAAELG